MNSLDIEINSLEEEIKILDKKKIDILMLIDFTMWNRLTRTMEQLCKYYIAYVHNQNEIDIIDSLYKEGQEKEKIQRIEELKLSIEMIKSEIKPYIEDRDEILNNISKDKINELQDIYIKIYELEDRKKNLKKLMSLEFES